MISLDSAQPQSSQQARPPLRVLLVDDHPLLRRALAEFIDDEPDLDVVGQASTGLEALRLAEQLRPDVVLMDVNLPVMNGVDATRRICASRSAARVVGLSMHADAPIAEAMRNAGAAAYVSKDAPLPTLLRAIRCAGV